MYSPLIDFNFFGYTAKRHFTQPNGCALAVTMMEIPEQTGEAPTCDIMV
jgi:hypothetical protein